MGAQPPAPVVAGTLKPAIGPRGTIRGVVRDAAYREPLARIMVTTEVAGKVVFATTDDHGAYELANLPPGTYAVEVMPYRVEPIQNLRQLNGYGEPAKEGVRLPIEVGPRVITRPLDLLAALIAR